MNLTLRYIRVIWFLLIPWCSFAQDISVKVFPDTVIYKRYYADALAHQLSLSKNTDSKEWLGNIGGTLPLADVIVHNHIVQLSLGTTVFNTLVKSPGHIQVYTVDYLVEFFTDTKITDNTIGRFTWGHLSSHYSDDGIVELQNVPINYVRDYSGLYVEHLLPSARAKIYGGFLYLYHNEPDASKRWTFQLGADAGLPLSDDILLYGAVDLKYKSEVNFGSTQSFQVGINYPAYRNGTSLRFAFTHRRGYEERGQLYNQSDNKNLLGIYLDF